MAEVSNFKLEIIKILYIKYDLAKNILHGESSPSLQYIVLGKIASVLWYQTIIHNATEFASVLCHRTIHNETGNTENFKSFNHVHQFEEKILKQLKHLAIPDHFIEELKNMIVKMKHEIAKFFDLLCWLELTFNPERVKIYMNSLSWTFHRSVDYLKTASYLVNNSFLETIERYKLACNFCLTKNINVLRRELPQELSFKFCTSWRLISFWNDYLKRNDLKRNTIIWREGEYGPHFYYNLLYFSLCDSNDLAVQYIWENINDIKMRDSIVYYVFITLMHGNSNILCYMLSQVNHDGHIEDICVAYGYEILRKLENEDRLHNCFDQIAKCVLKFIDKMWSIDAIKTVVLCLKKKVLTRNDQNFLDEFALKFNLNIKLNFILESKSILPLLLEINEEHIHKALLNIRSFEDGKKFLYDASYIGLFEPYHYNLCLLGMFIKEMFVSEEEINDFKNYIFDRISLGHRFLALTSNFITSNPKFLDGFLSFYCTKDKVSSFKKNLPYNGNGYIIGMTLKFDKPYGLANFRDLDEIINYVDKFLLGCFENDEREIANCKANLFNFQLSEAKFCKKFLIFKIFEFINKGKWKLLHKFLKWGLSTRKNIVKFKCNFVKWIKFHKDGYSFLKFIYCLYLKKNKIFKEFIRYFAAENEVAALKKKFQLLRVHNRLLTRKLLIKKGSKELMI